MKRNWTCSKCFLAFSRKWNLERHDKLIHGQYEQSGSSESSFKNKFEKPKFKSRQLEGSSYSLKHTLNDMFEFGEMLNKMSTSSQMFGRVNSLQSQVGSLQQELSYLKNHLNGLISSNWLIP